MYFAQTVLTTLRPFVLLLISIIALACTEQRSVKQSPETELKPIVSVIRSIESDSTEFEGEYGDYYFIAVSRGLDYPSLKRLAQVSAERLSWRFDALNRIYDSTKGIVCRGGDPNDDMYDGEYYPRRPFEDQRYSSIEMRHSFHDRSERVDFEDREMVVVVGMYDTRKSADSILAILQSTNPAAQVEVNSFYLGCMH